MDRWLGEHGYYRVHQLVEADNMYDAMKWGEHNAELYYLLVGSNPNSGGGGVNHVSAVICLGERMVHNPSRKAMKYPLEPVEDGKYLVMRTSSTWEDAPSWSA